jgi:cell filamentation protein
VTDQDPYLYPNSSVLRNKLGITDRDLFERIERRLVVQRATEGIPSGRFDLGHLRKIHRHLFQDMFDWAGEVRSVEIAKGGSQFQLRRFIETGMADIHRRLVAQQFLRGFDRAVFADAAATILGDVNYVHPFREGNGRTQLFYFEQLAEQAGHPIDLGRLQQDLWIEASRAAHQGDYRAMAEAIGGIMIGRR